eukprot:TRINITY_DN47244_c0_g1_i1.p1 TRINITY_DN47244_c0_g1~~TRINITY_DN47244_c0_g1_i1.p1  ORF type:complete len:270 (+),score=80.01 TRINITY_DN47244_c0_g1_i1:121-930(+)
MGITSSSAAGETAACCANAQKRSAVLMFGGSFSPMQLSHIAAAELGKRAVESSAYNLQVHSVRCSPVNDKYGKKGLWPAPDRLLLGMLALQEKASPGVVLDPWESEQERYMETHEVAQHLNKTYKGAGKADLFMLLGGADLFEGMFYNEPTPKIPYIWGKESVATLFNELDGVVIIQRAGSQAWEVEDIRQKLKTKLEGTGAEASLDSCVIIIAEDSAGDGSSTEVRALIGGGLQTPEDRTKLAQLVGQATTSQILSRADYFKGLVAKA